MAGKLDSHLHFTTRFSENVVVAGISYQMLEVLSVLRPGELLTSFKKANWAA